MQNERFKVHFYKEGNIINTEGKHRISMKVRFEGKEIYRKAIGSFSSAKIVYWLFVVSKIIAVCINCLGGIPYFIDNYIIRT